MCQKQHAAAENKKNLQLLVSKSVSVSDKWNKLQLNSSLESALYLISFRRVVDNCGLRLLIREEEEEEDGVTN